MIHAQDKNCTGCGACKAICPVSAISMNYDRTGFYAPMVDESCCIHCKKCIKVCPVLNPEHLDNKEPLVYAISAQDGERKKSSSGGFFPVLAKYVLRQGGYVCGAAWNKEWSVQHVIIDNERELDRLRHSKYVQSDTVDCFRKIAELLGAGKWVLFSGTPCQSVGLQKFLGRKYERLITVDIICHGAPSPQIWKKYLTENYDINAIEEICFRPKDNGWASPRKGLYHADCAYIKQNGIKKEIGVYYESFLNNLLSNESCMECPYRKVPRPSDFTMGDFWGYAAYDASLNDGKGLSTVLVNTSKAQSIFDIIKAEFKITQNIKIIHWQDIELDDRSRRSQARERLFSLLKDFPVTKSMDAVCYRRFDAALVSMINGCNYGSALVAYALQEILKSLGYTSVFINKRRHPYIPVDEQNKSLEFARNHCFLTRLYEHDESVSETNNLSDTFIVGSDTNWWWYDVCMSDLYYWLDFVHADKRKIAFSTSFAHDTIDIPREYHSRLRYLYSRFDALSSREESGVKNLKDIFHASAEHIYDPVLLAGEPVFSDLANTSTRTDKDYVFAYILDYTPEKEEILKHFSKIFGLPLRLVPNMNLVEVEDMVNEKSISVVDFLYLAKNASFFVTDSFHGTVFSVLFKKPFISLLNANRGDARYKIFYDMGLGENMVSDIQEVTTRKDYSLTPPDYTLADSILKREREKALEWLSSAMSMPKRSPEKADLLYDAMNERMDIERSRLRAARLEVESVKHVRYKYYKYAIMEAITFGQKKRKYKEKRRRMKYLLKLKKGLLRL